MNILLGISGSIAAYKAPWLVRDLVRAGHAVRTATTPSAEHFVSPLALQNVSKHAVARSLFDESAQSDGSWHIHLARWCHLMLVAPASATTIARLAHGLCDTTVSTLALALPRGVPLLIAPAMDAEMWEHPALQDNIATLRRRGAVVIGPESGELASGIIGPGRLASNDAILAAVNSALKAGTTPPASAPEADPFAEPLNPIGRAVEADAFNAELELAKLKQSMGGKQDTERVVLITAGPTFEPIDDVRFIGNHSSGKMGYALAEAARDAGATVVLVSGPVALPNPPGVLTVRVQTAHEMHSAAMQYLPTATHVLCAAAVADFRPADKVNGKLKKEAVGQTLTLTLVRNPDILHAAASHKPPGAVVVGFALESESLIDNARKKLHAKGADMIVANAAGAPDSGFGGDNNTVTLVMRNGTEMPLATKAKTELARDIVAATFALTPHSDR